MKKFSIFLLFVLLIITPVLANALPWAHDDDLSISLVQGTEVWSGISGYGGLFKIENVTRGETVYGFCVELDEWVYYADRVWYANNDVVWQGGRNTDSGDELSGATQWLYWRYLVGDPAYSNPKAIQLAIWYLEDEYSDMCIGDDCIDWYERQGGDRSLAELASTYVDAALRHNDFQSDQILAVNAYRIINGNQIQGQSYIYHIPEPGILILLGLGLVGVGAAARIRNKL